MDESINDIVVALAEIMEALRRLADEIVEAIKAAFAWLWDAILCATSNPRWVHYYKHAKRWRTRKKYYNRMRATLRDALSK